MKQLICTLLLVMSAVNLGAQSVAPEVVATSGTTFSNETLSIEWTLGEIMTETFSNTSVLTQGFHQPSTDQTSPVETVNFFADNYIVISPNPATDIVNIQLPKGAELLDLLNVAGQATNLRVNGQDDQLVLDVSSLPTGIYFLRVKLANGLPVARRLVVR